MIIGKYKMTTSKVRCILCYKCFDHKKEAVYIMGKISEIYKESFLCTEPEYILCASCANKIKMEINSWR